MPYVFSFKSTSLKEGKKLYTQMYVRNMRANMPPPSYTIKLGGDRVKNDKGTFIVPNFTLDRPTTKEELQECKTWIGLIRGGTVKVDTSDEEIIEDVTPAAGPISEVTDY